MDSVDYKYMDELFLFNYKEMEKRKIYSERELKVEKIDQGIILPYKDLDGVKCAGVVDANMKYIELSKFEALSEVDSWGASYEIDNLEKIPFVNKKVIYMGRFWKHWGHFLMDLISRLWFVLSEEYQDMKEDCLIAYDSNTDISEVYLELLMLLGIRESQLLRVEQPTSFQCVIVPECSHKPGIMVNQWYKKMYDVIIESALDLCSNQDFYMGKNIFFSRKMQGSRVPIEVGERDLENIFSNNGYLVISPEKYSAVEQISMVHLAKRIACVSGTLPHNMVFAHSGEELIVIRKTNKPNYRQTGIDEMRNLKVVTIDAHISLKPVGAAGPFIIDVNRNFRNYCIDNNMDIRIFPIIQWIKRKVRVLWYIPVWFARNYRNNPRVPLFDGEKFVNEAGAEKKLFWFYIKRI